MATIGNVTIRIGANTRQLQYDLRRAESALKKSVANMQGLGERLSIGLSAPILGLGAVSLRTAGDIQALQKGLISVMGSADAAALEFEKLREVAKLPGLGLEEAIRGSVNLQSAGFSADEARRSLLAFGNALATVGKGKNELNLVNLALTQLQNKTGGFGQDLRQLTEQLPQLRGALTAAFGTADSEKIQELGVTGREVVSRLTAELEKLPKVSGGINNAFENLGDSVKLALFTIGTSLNEAFGVESIFETLGNKIQEFADGFAALSPEVRKAIFVVAGLTAVLGPALIVFAQLYNAIQTVRIALIAFSATSGIITFIKLATTSVAGFSVAMKVLAAATTTALKAFLLNPVVLGLTLASGAVYLIYKNWELVKTALRAVGNFFIDIYNNSTLLRGVIQGIAFYFKTWFGFLQLIGKSFVNLLKLDFTAIKQDFNEFGQKTLSDLKTGIQNTFDPEPLERFKAKSLQVFKDIKGITDNANFAGITQTVNQPIGVLAPQKKTESLAPLNLAGEPKKIKTLNDQINDLKNNIEALSVAYAKTPTTGLLDKLNKQIDLLKSKESILENAEELVKRLSNPVTSEISLVPQIGSFEKAQKIISDFSLKAKETLLKGLSEGFKIETPSEGISSFFKTISDDIDKIQRQTDDGIISGLDGSAQKIGYLTNVLTNLRKNGFGKLSTEVVGIKTKLDEVGGFTGFSDLLDNVNRITGSLEVVGAGLNALGGLFDSFVDRQLSNIDKREERELEAINQSTLNEELKEKRRAEVEKKYDKERRAAQRKKAIADKLLGIFNATVSMFQGIAATLALGPAGLPLLPFVKGLGIANIAAIAAAPIPALAIGTDYVKSDGMAMLHKGEAVVPADVVGGGFSRGMGGKIELYSVIRGNDLWLLNNQNMQREKRLK